MEIFRASYCQTNVSKVNKNGFVKRNVSLKYFQSVSNSAKSAKEHQIAKKQRRMRFVVNRFYVTLQKIKSIYTNVVNVKQRIAKSEKTVDSFNLLLSF